MTQTMQTPTITLTEFERNLGLQPTAEDERPLTVDGNVHSLPPQHHVSFQQSAGSASSSTMPTVARSSSMMRNMTRNAHIPPTPTLNFQQSAGSFSTVPNMPVYYMGEQSHPSFPNPIPEESTPQGIDPLTQSDPWADQPQTKEKGKGKRQREERGSREESQDVNPWVTWHQTHQPQTEQTERDESREIWYHVCPNSAPYVEPQTAHHSMPAESSYPDHLPTPTFDPNALVLARQCLVVKRVTFWGGGPSLQGLRSVVPPL